MPGCNTLVAKRVAVKPLTTVCQHVTNATSGRFSSVGGFWSHKLRFDDRVYVRNGTGSSSYRIAFTMADSYSWTSALHHLPKVRQDGWSCGSILTVVPQDSYNSSGSIRFTRRVAESLARAWVSITPWHALTRTKTDWRSVWFSPGLV